MIIRHCIRWNPVIHAVEFFLYSKGSEPWKGLETGREIMSDAGLKACQLDNILDGGTCG